MFGGVALNYNVLLGKRSAFNYFSHNNYPRLPLHWLLFAGSGVVVVGGCATFVLHPDPTSAAASPESVVN